MSCPLGTVPPQTNRGHSLTFLKFFFYHLLHFLFVIVHTCFVFSNLLPYLSSVSFPSLLVKALSLCSCLCVRADFSYSIVFFFFSCLCFPSLPSSLFSQFLVRFPGIWSVLVVFVPVKEVLHFASIPLDFSLTVNSG